MSASKPCCPTCGRALTTPRQTKTRDTFLPRELHDTSRLSDAELHAYYKRVSGYFDVRFWAANNLRLSAAEQRAVGTLLETLGTRGGGWTPALRLEWAELRGRHWARRMAEDRAAGVRELNSAPATAITTLEETSYGQRWTTTTLNAQPAELPEAEPDITTEVTA